VISPYPTVPSVTTVKYRAEVVSIVSLELPGEAYHRVPWAGWTWKIGKPYLHSGACPR
jgi:hypothetical protein